MVSNHMGPGGAACKEMPVHSSLPKVNTTVRLRAMVSKKAGAHTSPLRAMVSKKAGAHTSQEQKRLGLGWPTIAWQLRHRGHCDHVKATPADMFVPYQQHQPFLACIPTPAGMLHL
jgi:hypothetical protein